MELLLNLAWLLLALPACWLWRGSRYARTGRRLTALQCLLSLACMLVILFPVVSATDDLHVMRAEMEESPLSKRSICQKTTGKPVGSKFRTQPFLTVTFTFIPVHDVAWHSPIISPESLAPAPSIRPTGRAPPVFFLA
jgi:hypothetical protein